MSIGDSGISHVSTTGTLNAKVLSRNEDEALWPGLAVEVALTVEVVRGVPSVPVSSVLPAQQGMIAWVIGPDSKVQPRVVTLARVVGQVAYVTEGLKDGERVVADGQGRIAPNMTVNVQEPKPPGARDGKKSEDRKS